jgi:hypothetical protein
MRSAAAPRGRFVGQPSAYLLALLLTTLIGACVALQVWQDRHFTRPADQDPVLYVQSGPVMQRLALSFNALWADVYWIRAIQHYGGTRRSTAPEKRYQLLYPLLSLAVALDPQFNIVYRFGSIFLAEPFPGGPGRPDQAIALLERGLEAKPGNWRYMQDIGFVYYWWVHDLKKAAEWFERGAQQPGAPFFMRSLAATTLAQGGDRKASRVLWQALADSDNDWLRRDASKRLSQLDALDQVDELQQIVKRAAQAGVPTPYSWVVLRDRGFIRAIPIDPAGIVYYLGPWSGEVKVADESPLQPLPTEPPHGAAR